MSRQVRNAQPGSLTDRQKRDQEANPMADPIQSATTPRQASFRHFASGAIVNTGCFHDIGCLPGGEDDDLDQWEAGFTDCEGRFYNRREAAFLVGVCGRLESESYFAGAANPTLEAGQLEAWHRPELRRAA
jgi:hypothetical protein